MTTGGGGVAARIRLWYCPAHPAITRSLAVNAPAEVGTGTRLDVVLLSPNCP